MLILADLFAESFEVGSFLLFWASSHGSFLRVAWCSEVKSCLNIIHTR